MKRNSMKRASILIMCMLLFSVIQTHSQDVQPEGRIIFSDFSGTGLTYFSYDFATDEFDIVSESYEHIGGAVFTRSVDTNNIVVEVCTIYIDSRCVSAQWDIVTSEQLPRYDLIASSNWLNDYEGFQWSPNDQNVAFINTNGLMGVLELYVMDVDGNNLRDLTPENNTDFHSPDFSWSPDSERVVFSCYDGEFLCITDIITSELIVVAAQENTIFRDVIWLPDGRILTFLRFFNPDTFRSEYTPYLIEADGSNLYPLIESGLLTNIPETILSPNGEMVAFRSRNLDESPLQDDISILHIGSGEITNLVATDQFSETMLVWSPDSQFIAYYAVDVNEPSPIGELHIVNVNDSSTRFIARNTTFQFVNTAPPILFWILD